MTGAALSQLIADAPVNLDFVKNLDLNAVEERLRGAGADPVLVVAGSWCQLGTMNIKANVEADALALVAPVGVVSTAGRRKVMGKSVKYRAIDFDSVRNYGPAEHTDERGYGRSGIEFAGAGNFMQTKNASGTRRSGPRRHLVPRVTTCRMCSPPVSMAGGGAATSKGRDATESRRLSATRSPELRQAAEGSA